MYLPSTFEGAILNAHASFIDWLYVTKKQVYIHEKSWHKYAKKDFSGPVFTIYNVFIDCRKVRVGLSRKTVNWSGVYIFKNIFNNVVLMFYFVLFALLAVNVRLIEKPANWFAYKLSFYWRQTVVLNVLNIYILHSPWDFPCVSKCLEIAKFSEYFPKVQT